MASWEKRSVDTYRLYAFRGYDSAGKKKTPQRKTIKITEKMTEKQLLKYLDKQAMLFQDEVDKGLYLDAGKLTFGQFSHRWMSDYAEKKLARKTISGYKDYLKRINQAIGHVKLDKLQPHHLLQFYNNLAEDGVRLDGKYVLNEKYAVLIEQQAKTLTEETGISARIFKNLLKGKATVYSTAVNLSNSLGISPNKLFIETKPQKGLDPKTILHHHRLISSILNKAIKWQVIISNPAARVETPKVKQKEAQSYDDEQVLDMFDLLDNEPLKYQAAIYIALYGGLRLGEVAGLEWNDLNFGQKTISISKARQYVSGHGSYDKEPKTERSKREIDLSDGVLNILREFKAEQEKERQSLGSQWIDSGKIFVQWNGLPMFPQTPSKWFNKWLTRTKLPKITFHQLRHSHASILIANGVDIATVSRRLGHSKISTTIDTYTHQVKSKDTAAANMLDDVITAKRRKT